MATIRKIGMAVGTFSVALGIGFVMQNGDALANRFGGDDASEGPGPFSQEDPVNSPVAQPELIDADIESLEATSSLQSTDDN